LDRRLGGPQIQSGRVGEEKNSQPQLGLEPPIIQLVAPPFNDQGTTFTVLSDCRIAFLTRIFRAGVAQSRCYSRQGLGIFPFVTVSRSVLGPTQPAVQWAPVAIFPRVKRLGREADHSPPSSAEVKEYMALYLHHPIRLQGVVLR
jgi:hypothetical protein